MNKGVIFLAIAFVIIAGGRVALSSTARGIRNKNPGNIRDTRGNTWDGQTGTDGEFAIFSSPEFGIRALAKLLTNYKRLYGIDTVKAIIERYAPSTENNTAAYINSVSSALGVQPEEPINIESRLIDLITAIIKHENGVQPYSADLISAGISMASGYQYA